MLTVAQIKRRKTTLGGFLAPLCFFNRTKLHLNTLKYINHSHWYETLEMSPKLKKQTHVFAPQMYTCYVCLLQLTPHKTWHTHTHRNVLKITHSSFSAKRPVCKQLWRSFWNCSATFNWFNHGEVIEIATLKEMEQTREEKGGKGGSAWQKRESFGA